MKIATLLGAYQDALEITESVRGQYRHALLSQIRAYDDPDVDCEYRITEQRLARWKQRCDRIRAGILRRAERLEAVAGEGERP